MTVEGGSNYRLEAELDGTTTLVITGAWSDAAAGLLESGRADGLDLNYAKGFKDTDLSFIRDWPIKRLSVIAGTVKDLSPVERLSGTLRSLSVESAGSAPVNLAVFSSLTTLAAEWIQVRSTISDAPQLQDLILMSYPENDLTRLCWNSALRRLRFKDRPRLQSLEGVEAFPALEHLGVYLAPLKSLDALRTIDAPLAELHVESCRVGDLAPLARLTSLRLLNASECGDLQSLRPIRNLRNLEMVWLYGTTKVLDDDLSPLLELPKLGELRMRSRRTYQPSVESIQRGLAEGREP